MATEPLLLVAASGLARETMAALRILGDSHPFGILDDAAVLHGTDLGGVVVLGGLDEVLNHPNVRLLVCAGSGIARSVIVDRLAGMGVGADRYATAVHPTASVASGSLIGPGTILLSNVVLTCDVTVGSHVVGMPNVTLTHDVIVDDFATLCAGVSVGGSVRVGRAAYLGMNASVRQQVRVGAGSTVGMGAVVINDVENGSTVVGNPARVLRSAAGITDIALDAGDVNLLARHVQASS